MLQAFSTEESARQLLRSVSSKLRPGGLFFGTIPDSGAIWYRTQKEKLPQIKGQLFSIEFRNDEFPTFGTRYRFRVDDGTDLAENLIHIPSLIRYCIYILDIIFFILRSTARDYELKMLEMANFEGFLEEHKRLYPKELAKVRRRVCVCVTLITTCINISCVKYLELHRCMQRDATQSRSRRSCA